MNNPNKRKDKNTEGGFKSQNLSGTSLMGEKI